MRDSKYTHIQGCSALGPLLRKIVAREDGLSFPPQVQCRSPTGPRKSLDQYTIGEFRRSETLC